MCTERVTMS
ncbi:hypothetical protein LINPERHAP1_LOCUS16842 [Linum perenne]